jgi:hypothetical protein
MASVSVLHGDAAEPVASTSERVWAIDSEQHAAWGANTEEGRNARCPDRRRLLPCGQNYAAQCVPAGGTGDGRWPAL